MDNPKIIITGPVGAGKSAAIASISDIVPVNTDEIATDMTKNNKPATTVAMDYGVIKLKGGQSLHLYGTPGQERFKFMWDILTEGGIGLVLLINNNSHNPMQDLHFFMNAFKLFIDKTRIVVGVTCMDLKNAPTLEEYQQQLSQSGSEIPVLAVDARDNRDVFQLIKTLLYIRHPGLET